MIHLYPENDSFISRKWISSWFNSFNFNIFLAFNIDKDSGNYGKSLQSQVALLSQRRAYQFGLFYQPYQKVGGIMFRVNGFNFNESGSSFVK